MALHARFDDKADEARRETARWVRIIREWQWGRDRSTGDELTGPAGELIEQAIVTRFSAGPQAKSITDAKGIAQWVGRGVRHRMMGAVAGMENNPLRDLESKLQLLKPPKISGDIDSPAWTWLQEHCDYGRAFLGRQSGVIGLQSMAMRPVLEEYKPGLFYPAGMLEIPPDQCFAIADPSTGGRPAVFGCSIDEGDATVYTASGRKWSKQGWYVWDFSDPECPVWGCWKDPGEWARWVRPDAHTLITASRIGGRMGKHGPEWVMAGPDFPWTWQGRAFMPIVCQTFDAVTRDLLPCNESEGWAVVDLILDGIWVNHVKHSGSFNRAFLLSDEAIDGFGQMLNEPNALTNLRGRGNKSLEVLPSSVSESERLQAMYEARYLKWTRRYSSSFEIQKTAAESGVAIRLRSASLFRLREDQIERARVMDTIAVKALIATHNGLQRTGQNAPVFGSPGLIPEGAFTLEYPRTLDAIEAEELADRLQGDVDRGVEYPERIHLLRRGIDNARPGDPDWEEATAYIEASLDKALQRAAKGYGLRPQDRYALTSATPQDEAALFVPPTDVADTAGRGLLMWDETRRGSLDGRDSKGRFLKARAKRLQGQEPMGLGEVRALNTWLRQHSDDGTQPDPSDAGEWGNDADPSGAWVDYQSQGGQPGLDWSTMVLAGQGGEPAPA